MHTILLFFRSCNSPLNIDFCNVVPSHGDNKNSPLKHQQSLGKRMDESPSISKTVHEPATVKMENSHSTHSIDPLSLSAIDRSIERSPSPRRSNSSDEFPPPEEEEAIFYSDLDPEESALAATRDLKRKVWDPSAPLDDYPTSSKSRAGSIERSSTLSLEKSVKKKKLHSESPDSRTSDDLYQTSNLSQKVVYHKGQPTATPILIYEDTRREVVQQCIANLMSTFHNHYPHSEVIAYSFTGRFEDMLTNLYRLNRAKRYDCKNWRSWPRKEFVEHLRLLYPRSSNVTDKGYLQMIRDLPFEYDLENPAVELKYQAELTKIVKHYDSLTRAEELEAVEILLGKINNPSVFNWQPIFDKQITECDLVPPICTVNDFRFVLQMCFHEARQAKSQAVLYMYAVDGSSRTKFFEGQLPLEDNSLNITNKNISKASHASASAVEKCTFCGKNNHVNADCRTKSSEFSNHTDRPYIGSKAHKRMVKIIGPREWIPNIKELRSMLTKAGHSSSSSSSAPKSFKDFNGHHTCRHIDSTYVKSALSQGKSLKESSSSSSSNSSAPPNKKPYDKDKKNIGTFLTFLSLHLLLYSPSQLSDPPGSLPYNRETLITSLVSPLVTCNTDLHKRNLSNIGV